MYIFNQRSKSLRFEHVYFSLYQFWEGHSIISEHLQNFNVLSWSSTIILNNECTIASSKNILFLVSYSQFWIFSIFHNTLNYTYLALITLIILFLLQYTNNPLTLLIWETSHKNWDLPLSFGSTKTYPCEIPNGNPKKDFSKISIFMDFMGFL